ncbi:hypothetical protein BV22DRAFT_1186828 [Leucogyrophana mollusca]|uniref:Uncharacterized protein n=1 Tax=Leucogyrophana mollusca TaxID=85980 RepID=A0ACB8AXW1_9AGAM|nr:hypothetical protein BV22DRAFT_1186828 [Leucogyrophana mollusca]
MWTETAEALLRPPSHEFNNLGALHTIALHPDLFQVSTPINVDLFESLLSSHPNHPFVISVCRGLCEGFWPFADTNLGSYPVTWDNSDQIAKEALAGQYSCVFSLDLLPGMYSMPTHMVPKPGGNFRLITNHSTGEYSLNSMISRENNVRDLGNAFNEFLHLWKADIVSFEGQHWVDWKNVFGGRASQQIWHTFMALILWIAVVRLCLVAFLYVDDSFSFERGGVVAYYAPYKKYLPHSLGSLLELWDSLGISHHEAKQVFGYKLPIIGFEVNPNVMLVQISDESRKRLIERLMGFAKYNKSIVGDLNWALNVYPLLHPGLCAIYSKIVGKQSPSAPLWINHAVVEELLWVVHHLTTSEGIFFLKSVPWMASSAAPDIFQVMCDASGVAMAFWYPSLGLGFQLLLPPHPWRGTILFHEALAVCSAIHEAGHHFPRGSRLAVFTDNMNTVHMFNSLAADPDYNPILILAVNVILASRINVHIFHIAGVDNIVADHLSQNQNVLAERAAPRLVIETFQPPQDVLGAALERSEGAHTDPNSKGGGGCSDPNPK